MFYAKLKEDGSYDYRVATSGNIEWDSTHFCPASALTANEAVLFRVIQVTEMPFPNYDPITQYVREIGPTFDQGSQHWIQTWTVVQLSPEQVASNQAAAKEQNNNRIKAEIAALDLRRIRPLAEGDTTFLATLNTQILALRSQLK